MQGFHEFRATYGVAFAFLLLAFFGGWAIHLSANHQSESLYQTQIKACERGNTLRAESNQRIPAHEADTAVLREFLTTARTARLATYRFSHQRSDLTAASRYGSFIRTLDTKVRFDDLNLIDCKKVIPKP